MQRARGAERPSREDHARLCEPVSSQRGTLRQLMFEPNLAFFVLYFSHDVFIVSRTRVVFLSLPKSLTGIFKLMGAGAPTYEPMGELRGYLLHAARVRDRMAPEEGKGARPDYHPLCHQVVREQHVPVWPKSVGLRRQLILGQSRFLT